MKKILILAILSSILYGCHSTAEQSNNADNNSEQSKKATAKKFFDYDEIDH